ncbi:META domain-containing protein [Chryseobacterium lacus]|uniref:META domain-containing protein n=1 Tax=Chryseobacterium lacus TaxID=2058346 RepID=A0A368N2G2_9FLAO|nr:META domain-containing protein [Chryseobacterium lacus]RCU44722.1 META domain-containing protein [Chryseobacterium lacus]RST32386.1 META domain-containing protein [Chryseobacterium lacus]
MKTLLTLAIAAMITSCAPTSTTVHQPANTIQKTWELVSLEGQEVTTSTPIYLNFADNKLSGNTGCNTVNGNFTIMNTTQIKFSQLASTRMMCDRYDMKIENEMLEVLKTADNFTINDGKLMLNVGRRAPLAVFVEMSKNPVINKSWKLKEMNGNKVVMVLNQDKEQGFMLRSNGKITGSDGCNTFFGSYKLSDGNKISINENLGTTMKACPDMKLNEKEFFNVLKNAEKYDLKGNTLMLKNSNGQLLAIFDAM